MLVCVRKQAGQRYPGWRYSQIAPDAYSIGKDKNIRICLDKVPELALVGGAVKIVDASIDDSLIVVRETEDVYVAASIKCTHRGVEVEYRAEDKCFKCASLGGSRFKTNGEKVRGFAKGPLKTYPISREAAVFGVPIDKSPAAASFSELLLEKIKALAGELDPEAASALEQFVNLADEMGIQTNFRDIQSRIYEILETKIPTLLDELAARKSGREGTKLAISTFLSLARRFNFNTDPLDKRLGSL